jgi:hypothetical protein
MPRGFKVWNREWTEMFPDGFKDKRSFISQPKLIKGEGEAHSHYVVWGKDKATVRAEIFQRNREANGGHNICCKCGRRISEGEPGGWTLRGEWNHIRNKPGERCDCPENGECLCPRCHRERHPKPQFSRKEIA